MRIAIIGNGRMARAIAQRAGELGDEVVCTLNSRTNPGGSGITAEAMRDAQVAFEFTTPDAVLPNLDRLTALRVPTVVGTTGWYDHLTEVRRWVEERGAALVYAANFAPGVHLFLRLAREAGRLFAPHEDFDANIVEVHHRAKRDAPSGTARVLRNAVRESDPGRDYPITSIRTGHVPGEHRLVYDATDETITLAHEVRSRHVFAAGALHAGRWIADRKGLYEFSQVLFGAESP
jgi:4-hydroxy-tetrahydrodipicolinate reductase